jgi:hypothetical protein
MALGPFGKRQPAALSVRLNAAARARLPALVRRGEHRRSGLAEDLRLGHLRRFRRVISILDPRAASDRLVTLLVRLLIADSSRF